MAMYDMLLAAAAVRQKIGRHQRRHAVRGPWKDSTGATFYSESHATGQWMPGLNAYFDGTMTNQNLFVVALEKNPILSLNGIFVV